MTIKSGGLELTSMFPDQKRVAYVNGERVESYYSVWDGRAFVAWWGEKLAISLDCNQPRPSDQQIDRLQEILAHSTPLRSKVESELLQYYAEEVVKRYRTDCDGNPMPDISDRVTILSMLGEPTLTLDVFHAEHAGLSFRLDYQSDWDEEHSIPVEVVDWQVTSIA